MKNIMKCVKMTAMMLAVCAVLLSFVFPTRAEFRYTPIIAEIPFTCEKADVAGGGTYDIVLEALEGTVPMPAESIITIQGTGAGAFGIEIDEPGTYQYIVYERAGTNSKIVYDDTTYTVTLFVTTTEEGVLEYQVILSKDGLIKPTEVRFVNKASGHPSGTIIATGETQSVFIPYAVACFVIASIILILAFRRRKRGENDG